MLILASGSPRRRELLEQIGAAYEVKVGTYAEDVPKNDDPEKFVIRQAAGKAASIAEKYTGRWVLGAAFPAACLITNFSGSSFFGTSSAYVPTFTS